MRLTWRDYSLDLDQRTHVMGVLNVTPDSFADGGRYYDKEAAIRHALEMDRLGADMVDVGGESTRPYSGRLSADEEMEGGSPVIEAVSRKVALPISIDTYKSEVAREALKAGACMINDISALRFDPGLADVAARAGVPVVLMHMKGTPENMQVQPTYDDLLGEVMDFLTEAVERAVRAGIHRDRILIDPGIGFGKTFDHNLILVRELRRFQSLGCPILIGSSNKSFIGHILNRTVEERDAGTMATVAAAVIKGAHVVRVHNVRMAVDTVRMVDAIERGAAAERTAVGE